MHNLQSQKLHFDSLQVQGNGSILLFSKLLEEPIHMGMKSVSTEKMLSQCLHSCSEMPLDKVFLMEGKSDDFVNIELKDLEHDLHFLGFDSTGDLIQLEEYIGKSQNYFQFFDCSYILCLKRSTSRMLGINLQLEVRSKICFL